MKFNITGRNIEVTQRLKDQIELKIGKLEKLLPKDSEAFITLETEKINQKIEVTIPLKKRTLRGEVKSADMYSAIDEVVDILESQLVKYKSRLKKKGSQDISYKEEFHSMYDSQFDDEDYGEHTINIGKSKRFALKPMDAEEAVMEMELLGHNFFVFRNGVTDEVNVVYKRKNNSYGLIEPEY